MHRRLRSWPIACAKCLAMAGGLTGATCFVRLLRTTLRTTSGVEWRTSSWKHFAMSFSAGPRSIQLKRRRSSNVYERARDAAAHRYPRLERTMGIPRRFVPWLVRPELFDIGHLHELYRLLNLRFESFSEETKRTTIEALRNITIPDGDEQGPGRIERLQFRWLSAISVTSYEPAAKWFGGLAAKYGAVPKYPDTFRTSKLDGGPGRRNTPRMNSLRLLNGGHSLRNWRRSSQAIRGKGLLSRP